MQNPKLPQQTQLGNISRRRFLARSSALTAFMALPSHVVLGAGEASPNNKLNIAGIGIGGQGASDLNDVSSQNIVALCDVDWDYAAHTFKKYPDAKRYKDFREMLDKEKSIDAVVVGTPDHNHAIVSITAIKHGKHVYCEKPLTRTVFEARAVAKAAREAKVATQMGNQGMAFEGNRLINEWLWDGAIGPVREAHVWSDRPTHRGKTPLWWAQGIERPKDTPPVPPTMEWDLWLGPAPTRPYHPAYAPFRWRGWWDFGSGGLGDMGIHNLAPVFSALKLGAPESVQASSTPVFPETVPVAAMVHYQFPARGEMPAVKLHWYDGGLLPERPAELEPNRELDPEDGIIFVGDKGKMIVTGWGGEHPRLLPETLDKEYKRPAKSLPRSIGHHKEWIEACKHGSETRSNFDFAGPLTEAVLLGSVCIRNGGEKLIWDAENLKITNDPDANKFLHYEYRQGWSL
ncbi:MAG TPA: Gfo/Idh/MocA family oxidoreductase [Candidatus Limnocylindrales bacterium]|jgi:predicted dehydrogenase|nr:Gfo/Idh/MocA family oxidoreductase [Candidatus Limnocylindrales bacterium]